MRGGESGSMAKDPPKPAAKHEANKEDRLAMLRELAKVSKPTGPSAKGEATKEEE